MEALLPYITKLLQGGGGAAVSGAASAATPSAAPMAQMLSQQPQQADQTQQMPQQAMPANMAIPNNNLKKVGSAAKMLLGVL